jgi:hypothetical protein
MAKLVCQKPEWLEASGVTEIYSVSGCISKNFADYIRYWKHNGYWLFDSPEIMQNIAQENSIELKGTSLFYYEAHELEFDGEAWHAYQPEQSFPTHVVPPQQKHLEGFDVITFWTRTTPECSPLSCNYLATKMPTNARCLFTSFDDAEQRVSSGAFNDSEPGPYRIFAVYFLDWPPAPKLVPNSGPRIE